MHRNLWLLFAVVGLAAAAFLLLRSGRPDRPFDESAFAAPPDAAHAAPELRTGATDAPADEVERRELELAQDLGLVASLDDVEARAVLALRGRVVTREGQPIAGARVEPRIRRSARAIFQQDGPPLDIGGDFRALFRDRPLAKAIVTGADGVFAFDGRGFGRGTNIELAIEHDRFAPAVVHREWSADEGDLVVDDVVLGAGAVVTGVVVGPHGAPVPDATVRFDEEQRRGRGRGGRGGPGGRFGGFDDDRLTALVGEVRTDAAGRFELRQVPAGEFRLTATARRHVDGRSEQLEAGDGAMLDAGTIELGPGAELVGIVVDARGAPVADAEVAASVSRATLMQRMRDQQSADAGERGGRSGLRQMLGFGNARTSTRTDAEGRFTLDRVPQAPLRLEVRHPAFTDEDVEPIDPLAQPQVRVQLRGRPWASGVVVDAQTGDPIESFGIRARPMPGGGFGGGGRGGRGPQAFAQQMAQSNPEMAERIAEAQARAQREQDRRKRLIGGSGIVPRRIPEPTRHPEGAFRLDDLQPGEFVFEVAAPGYVPIAAGPFTCQPADGTEGITIRLERGVVMAGRVVDGRTGAPVARARVALAVPPEGQQNGDDPFAAIIRFDRGGRGDFRDAVAEARTDSAGRFEMHPLRSGTYALEVEARDYPGFSNPSFALTSATTGNDIALDPGARVHGTVVGLEPGQRARLQFVHAETNESRTTRVSPDDGSYEIAGLLAGGYFVEVEEDGDQRGRGRGDLRQRIGAMVSSHANAAPDLVVSPGADVRYDPAVASLEYASVRGHVFANGQPGAGLTVRLVAQVEETGLDPRVERFAAGRLQQLFSDEVSAEDGSFEIESVPPGDYRLEVRPRGGRGGRGRRGGAPTINLAGAGGAAGALHGEPLMVRKGQTVERTVQIVTGSIALQLTGPDGQPLDRVRVSLVRADEAGDNPPDTWQQSPSFVRSVARGGRVEAAHVTPGAWRYFVTAQGHQPVEGRVDVMAGATPAPTQVQLAVDPNAPPQPQGAGAGGGEGRQRPGGGRRGNR